MISAPAAWPLQCFYNIEFNIIMFTIVSILYCLSFDFFTLSVLSWLRRWNITFFLHNSTLHRDRVGGRRTLVWCGRELTKSHWCIPQSNLLIKVWTIMGLPLSFYGTYASACDNCYMLWVLECLGRASGVEALGVSFCTCHSVLNFIRFSSKDSQRTSRNQVLIVKAKTCKIRGVSNHVFWPQHSAPQQPILAYLCLPRYNIKM